jgi:predicted RNA-binding protein with PUA-like domain
MGASVPKPKSTTSAKTPKKSTSMSASTKKPNQSASANAAPNAPHAEGRWAQWFTRAPGERRYWLVKSEPTTFSFAHLVAAPGKTTGWDGVRNFVARNFMRDGMKKGDLVFFYHSSTNPQAIVGIAEVAREAYADATAQDPKHHSHDPKATPDDPIWYQVDIKAVKTLARPVTLAEIKGRKELANMALLRIGRLSVTPVSADEWRVITELAGEA